LWSSFQPPTRDKNPNLLVHFYYFTACGLSTYAENYLIMETCVRIVSARLEKKNCNLAKVKVDEVLGLVRHIRTKVPPDDAVPSGVVFLVELLFDVRCNVLLDAVLIERLSSRIDGILLHSLRHISILNDGFAQLAHGELRFDLEERRNETMKNRATLFDESCVKYLNQNFDKKA